MFTIKDYLLLGKKAYQSSFKEDPKWLYLTDQEEKGFELLSTEELGTDVRWALEQQRNNPEWNGMSFIGNVLHTTYFELFGMSVTWMCREFKIQGNSGAIGHAEILNYCFLLAQAKQIRSGSWMNQKTT